MYVTEKEMRDRLKLDSKSDLIGKLIMAYMTIRKLQEQLECAKNTEQLLQPDTSCRLSKCWADCQPHKSGDLHGQATKLPGGLYAVD